MTILLTRLFAISFPKAENSMSSVNVRVSSQSYQLLKSLAEDSDQSMQALIDEALENLRRRKVLEATDAAFSALKANKRAWKEELKERRLWEKTLSDGVE